MKHFSKVVTILSISLFIVSCVINTSDSKPTKEENHTP